MIIDVAKIIQFHAISVNEWHEELALTQTVEPWTFIEENHQWNFKLWHEEDIARIIDIEPSRMVVAKRNIDAYNQARNNAMEKIDEWILRKLGKELSHHLPLHSETPGMMIDRISIMSLKRYHMQEEVVRVGATQVHQTLCSSKVATLDEQIRDLSNCLKIVLEKLLAGELGFKVYRQLKMYNDPSLNPELYKRDGQ
jgi:hypothetical protein